MNKKIDIQYPENLDLPRAAHIPASLGAPRREAYERVRADIAAVHEGDLETINVDVDAVVAVVSAALPQIQAVREAIARELPRFDIGRFDKLGDYTLAMHVVNNALHESEAPAHDMPAIYARAVEMRDTLVDAMRILARFKIVDRAVVENAGTAQGYRAVGAELEGLVGVFRAHVAEVVGKTPVTKEHLARAEALANELFTGIDERARLANASATITLERRQAYTLFVRAYADARRAIRYLRAEAGDAEVIAPSLYAGRGGRGAVDPEVVEPEAAQPSTSPEAASGPVASAVPVSASVAPKVDGGAKRGSIFVPVGEDPFTG